MDNKTTSPLARLRNWPDGLTVEADQERAKIAQDAADEIERLRAIIRAIIRADERGQGLPFQEAMGVAVAEVGYGY